MLEIELGMLRTSLQVGDWCDCRIMEPGLKAVKAPSKLFARMWLERSRLFARMSLERSSVCSRCTWVRTHGLEQKKNPRELRLCNWALVNLLWRKSLASSVDIDDANAFEDAFGEASGYLFEDVPADAFDSRNLSFQRKRCIHLKNESVYKEPSMTYLGGGGDYWNPPKYAYPCTATSSYVATHPPKVLCPY